MNMETKLICIITAMLVFAFLGCTSVGYQVLKIDYANNEISIINSDEFVIDSISIERFGILYFSKSLREKSKGVSVIKLDESNTQYKVFVDNLHVLECDMDNLSLDIFIRKKGSTFKIAKKIAMNFKHLNSVQTLRGLKYEHCSQRIDTFETERRYR